MNAKIVCAVALFVALCASMDCIARDASHQTTKPSNHQTTKPSNHQTTKPSNHQTSLVIGADISGATYLEKRGYSFAGFDGRTNDVFQLMKQMGVDAVRLRVWVDPWEGWCGEDETAAKALRAAAAGLDIMLDFHYSDSWADPGNQTIPKAWSGRNANDVAKLLYAHTRRTLEKCRKAGAAVRWVQIGNEVAGGILWTPWRDDNGKAHWEEVRPGEWAAVTVESLGNNVRNPENWAMFVKIGSRAVHDVFPDAKIVIHLPNAHDTKAISASLRILKSRGVKWDVIGVSLYTYHEDERKAFNGDVAKIKAFDAAHINRAIKSIRGLYSEFKTPVMIVETGFEVEPPNGLTVDYSANLMSWEMKNVRGSLRGMCTGVFYWEPTSLPGEYPLGAFTLKGKTLCPTAIMCALTGKGSYTPRR